MTIAACYVSPEGVILGADSTTTFSFVQPGGVGKLPHYFNYAQKLFEISQEVETETLGIVTWGLGGLGTLSYRTLVGRFADSLKAAPANTLQDAATRWSSMFWNEWVSTFQNEFARLDALGKTPNRTRDQEEEYQTLLNLGVGFCMAGYCGGDQRTAGAYELVFDPRRVVLNPPNPPPVATAINRLPVGYPIFWGVPVMIKRLLVGIDDKLADEIETCGKWTGTRAELDAIITKYRLSSSFMPIRDAIDFVDAGIYSTIKGLKFSSFSQICGGPIEIAVITSDRKFRWVRHKRFDEAIFEQEGGIKI